MGSCVRPVFWSYDPYFTLMHFLRSMKRVIKSLNDPLLSKIMINNNKSLNSVRISSQQWRVEQFLLNKKQHVRFNNLIIHWWFIRKWRCTTWNKNKSRVIRLFKYYCIFFYVHSPYITLLNSQWNCIFWLVLLNL